MPTEEVVRAVDETVNERVAEVVGEAESRIAEAKKTAEEIALASAMSAHNAEVNALKEGQNKWQELHAQTMAEIADLRATTLSIREQLSSLNSPPSQTIVETTPPPQLQLEATLPSDAEGHPAPKTEKEPTRRERRLL